MDETGHNRQDENSRDRDFGGDALFRAVLTPNRSLSPFGFMVLMGVVSCISFVIGAVFWTAGAWPVMGFFGLDVAAIYFAFRLNYRSGRMYETVEVYPKVLVLTRVDPEGRYQVEDFNSYWVRVLLSEERDGRCALALGSHGRKIVVGKFLSDDERRDFAGALKLELAKAREALIARG